MDLLAAENKRLVQVMDVLASESKGLVQLMDIIAAEEKSLVQVVIGVEYSDTVLLTFELMLLDPPVSMVFY